MNKHTPGPWYAPPLPASGTDLGIMHLPQNKAPVLVALVVIDEDDPQTDDEHAANARLIAAAPDLLAACDRLMVAWEERGVSTAHDWADAVSMARAAIAKATGQKE